MIARRRLFGAAAALGLAAFAPAAKAQSPEAVKLRDELMVLEKGSWDFMRNNNADVANLIYRASYSNTFTVYPIKY